MEQLPKSEFTKPKLLSKPIWSPNLIRLNKPKPFTREDREMARSLAKRKYELKKIREMEEKLKEVLSKTEVFEGSGLGTKIRDLTKISPYKDLNLDFNSELLIIEKVLICNNPAFADIDIADLTIEEALRDLPYKHIWYFYEAVVNFFKNVSDKNHQAKIYESLNKKPNYTNPSNRFSNISEANNIVRFKSKR